MGAYEQAGAYADRARGVQGSAFASYYRGLADLALFDPRSAASMFAEAKRILKSGEENAPLAASLDANLTFARDEIERLEDLERHERMQLQVLWLSLLAWSLLLGGAFWLTRGRRSHV